MWYTIIGDRSGWAYDYCGMCDGCVASEWKEYKTDFRDNALQHEVELRAYHDWGEVLTRTVQRESVRSGIEEEVKLVYCGSGGKEKMLRRLRKEYFARTHHVPLHN